MREQKEEEFGEVACSVDFHNCRHLRERSSTTCAYVIDFRTHGFKVAVIMDLKLAFIYILSHFYTSLLCQKLQQCSNFPDKLDDKVCSFLSEDKNLVISVSFQTACVIQGVLHISSM